jgi:[ribosomal protein S18]-alanine N-acetyltransferase
MKSELPGVSPPLTVRILEPRDVESVLEIQSACPEIAQWTVWDYERVARGEMSGWVAEAGGGVAGFLVARKVAADVEILNFAVRFELRRQGMGAALLREVFGWGKSFGAESAFLEVRASNLDALRFYENHNFRATGRRPRYYAAPVDDALLLSVALK